MVLNSCTFKHSSLSRPLKDSQSPLSVGFLGLVNAKLTRFTCAQSSITKEVNSVPWSTVIEAGNWRLCAARSKAKITSSLVSLKPVSSNTLSRLQLSTTVSTRKAKPLASWSSTKWPKVIPVGPYSSAHWGHLLVVAYRDAMTDVSYAAGASEPASPLGNTSDGLAWYWFASLHA